MGPSYPRLIAAACLGVLLAACAGDGIEPLPEGDQARLILSGPELYVPAPPAAEPAEEPEPQVARRPPAPVVDDNPERLIGLGPIGLVALLGQPELIRRERPAQIWQYRDGACVFDVVLYEEGDGERVTYVEARDDGGNRVEPRPCLNRLLRAHLSAEAS